MAACSSLRYLRYGFSKTPTATKKQILRSGCSKVSAAPTRTTQPTRCFWGQTDGFIGREVFSTSPRWRPLPRPYAQGKVESTASTRALSKWNFTSRSDRIRTGMCSTSGVISSPTMALAVRVPMSTSAKGSETSSGSKCVYALWPLRGSSRAVYSQKRTRAIS